MSPAWLYSKESRTESSGVAPNDPAVKNTEIFLLVLETRPVRRKPMGRWKEFKRKDCQIILNLSELLRAEERKWEDCFSEDFCLTSNCVLLETRSLSTCLSFFFYVCLPGCLSLCQAGCQSVCSPVHSRFVFEFLATPPTPQPTDDVDIYFETPADDKEHSRFQRAKEQLEIRHRDRMERVSDQFEWGQHFPNKEKKGQFLLPKCIKNICGF